MKGVIVGRIVHFHPPTADQSVAEAQAAIITKIHDDKETVNLSVFPDSAARQSFNSVPFSEKPAPYSWHWPEKV